MPSSSSPIRVAQYSDSWLAQTETWLYDQVTSLPDWICSHVICANTANLDQFPIPPQNLHNFASLPGWLKFADRLARRSGLRNFRSHTRNVCAAAGIELLHSHFGNCGWNNLGVVKKLGLHHITTFYGLDVNYLPVVDPAWLGRYRQLFEQVDRILCEGPHMARCIADLGCPPERITVHHLGVRTDQIAFQPRLWQPGSPLRVLMAASFRQKKGIPDAIDALGRIRHRVNLQLTIVGGTTQDSRTLVEEQQIQRALDRNHLRAQTSLPGFLPYNQLMQLAASHHIFISPSLTASDGDTEGGAPIGILHMAASGMPVVSTKHCDIPNLLPPDAHLAAERDIDALAAELERLIDHTELWPNQLLCARRRIESHFDAARQGRKLADIYRHICRPSLACASPSLHVV